MMSDIKEFFLGVLIPLVGGALIEVGKYPPFYLGARTRRVSPRVPYYSGQ